MTTRAYLAKRTITKRASGANLHMLLVGATDEALARMTPETLAATHRQSVDYCAKALSAARAARGYE